MPYALGLFLLADLRVPTLPQSVERDISILKPYIVGPSQFLSDFSYVSA